MARDSKEYVSLPVYGEGGVKRHVSLRPGISVVVDLVALRGYPRHFGLTSINISFLITRL
jgi:hypothetical protein